MAENVQHAVVIGGGTMGAGVAVVFAAAGWRVSVVEPHRAARESLRDRMAETMARAEVAPADVEANMSGVAGFAAVPEVDWSDVAIVVESALEDLGVKRTIFAALEANAPADIPIGSNSTGYSIDAIAEGLSTRSRMLGTHFLMPAQFVPLVELVPSPLTDPAIVDAVRDTMTALGKRPVLVNKPLIGFLANRMQAALMREALSLIDRGVASPEDVDAAVQLGFGFRYAAAGPILQKEHSGWEISYSLYEKVFPDLCNDAAPTPSLSRMIAERHFGMKTKQGFLEWSDEAIASERARYETALMAALKVLKLGAGPAA